MENFDSHIAVRLRNIINIFLFFPNFPIILDFVQVTLISRIFRASVRSFIAKTNGKFRFCFLMTMAENSTDAVIDKRLFPFDFDMRLAEII